jgi:hypothetical protein
MRRGYVAYAALLAMVILLFTGCDALIGNAFKAANLGQPSVEKIKELDTAALVAQAGITSGSVSDTFIQTIISDDATKAAVLATLQTTVDTGSASDAQAAQALILDIRLADIGADEVISNVSKSIGDVVEQLDKDEPDYAAIIDALLPDTSDLATMINNLGGLMTDYDTLAQNIGTNGNTLDEGVVASAAQSALLAVIVSNSTPSATYGSVGAAAAALVEDIKANSSDPDYSPNIEDYLAEGPDFSEDSPLISEGSTLYTLFDAAGLGDLLDQLSGSGS